MTIKSGSGSVSINLKRRVNNSFIIAKSFGPGVSILKCLYFFLLGLASSKDTFEPTANLPDILLIS